MQEKTISLHDLHNDDVIAIGDAAYKVKNIRDVLEDLLKSTYRDFSIGLNNLKTNKLGICSEDSSSILQIYSGDYCDFEYLKIGSSNWRTAKAKIYLSAFLYLKESDLVKQNEFITYYPQLAFNDEDVVSFKQDCLCKMKSIKNAFKLILTDNRFVSTAMQKLSSSLGELADYNLFRDGKECELLRLGDSKWEHLTIGIQFTIDAIEDDLMNEQNISSNRLSQTSAGYFNDPLDEIRNTAES
jgi:hypothetical protein